VKLKPLTLTFEAFLHLDSSVEKLAIHREEKKVKPKIKEMPIKIIDLNTPSEIRRLE